MSLPSSAILRKGLAGEYDAVDRQKTLLHHPSHPSHHPHHPRRPPHHPQCPAGCTGITPVGCPGQLPLGAPSYKNPGYLTQFNDPKWAPTFDPRKQAEWAPNWYANKVTDTMKTEFSDEANKDCTTCTTLILWGADFTEEGMPSEADWALFAASLTYVNLSRAKGVTREGVAALERMCVNLETLATDYECTADIPPEQPPDDPKPEQQPVKILQRTFVDWTPRFSQLWPGFGSLIPAYWYCSALP